MSLAAQPPAARMFGRLRSLGAETFRKSIRNRRRPSLEGLERRQLLATQSLKVAIIGDALNSNGSPVSNGGYLPTTGSDMSGINFSAMAPADVSAANLASYDTVVLNVASHAMNNTVSTLSASQKADLVSFVGNGGKMIIYDSETSTQDYSWLPTNYAFTTSNPGASEPAARSRSPRRTPSAAPCRPAPGTSTPPSWAMTPTPWATQTSSRRPTRPGVST